MRIKRGEICEECLQSYPLSPLVGGFELHSPYHIFLKGNVSPNLVASHYYGTDNTFQHTIQNTHDVLDQLRHRNHDLETTP